MQNKLKQAEEKLNQLIYLILNKLNRGKIKTQNTSKHNNSWTKLSKDNIKLIQYQLISWGGKIEQN